MKKKETTEIYIRISKGSGKKKDTAQHSASTKEEAIEFINKHA